MRSFPPTHPFLSKVRVRRECKGVKSMVGYYSGLGRLRCYVQYEEFPTPVERETLVAILREKRETGRDTVE